MTASPSCVSCSGGGPIGSALSAASIAAAVTRWVTWTARVLGLGLAVGASLLAFPSVVPWMIALWIVWATIRMVAGRGGVVPLVTCAAIVLVKRVPWTPGVLAVAAVVAGVVVVLLLAHPRRSLRCICAAALWIAWAYFLYDWESASHCSRRPVLLPDLPVVCFGDSMTSMGPPQGGYPEVLAGMVTVPVLNLGWPGLITSRALARLPELIDRRPQAVVLELGGNDYMQPGHTREEVRGNLEEIIAACRQIGAEVILVEVPRDVVSDPYWGLERELARKYDLELIPDTPIRRLVLSSPAVPRGPWTLGPCLTQADGLHPNALGNRLLADYAAAALQRLYGPAVLRGEWQQP